MPEPNFFETDRTRKGEIIETSLRIVDTLGLKGLTVARIAHEVGFTESALYRHFRSKSEIISLILDETRKVAETYLGEARTQAASPREALTLTVRLHLTFLARFPGLFRICFSDEIHLGQSDLMDRLRALSATLLSFVAGIIEDGKREGDFRPDLDASVAAVHYLGLIQASFAYWTLQGRTMSLPETGVRLCEQLVTGFRKE